MKISGLLLEKANYDAQLMGDINAYLISLKANDIPSVGDGYDGPRVERNGLYS